MVSVTYTFCPYCGFDLRPLIRIKAREEVDLKRILLYRFRNLLYKPDKIFREIALTPDLIGPFLIMLVSAFFLALRFPILLPNSLNLYLFALFFLTSLAVVFTISLFITFIVHMVVRIIGGTGNFAVTLSIFGYSFIPSALGLLIIDLYLLSVPKELITLNSPLNLIPVFRTAFTMFSVFLLITAFYFSFGLAYAHGMDRKFSFLVSYISFGLVIAVLLA